MARILIVFLVLLNLLPLTILVRERFLVVADVGIASRYLEPLVEKDISVGCWLIGGARCINYGSDFTPILGLRRTKKRVSQNVQILARQLRKR